MDKIMFDSSIDDFSAYITESYKPWPEYIFRGQSNSEWKIESSLSRQLNKITGRNKKIIEQNHYKNFRQNIRGRRGDNPNQLSNQELKALGQHYGLYTTFLDWTKSPYVALFFALLYCTDEYKYCSVYSLDSFKIDQINKTESNSSKNYIVNKIEPEDDFNKRIVNQSGLFLDISIETDFNEWIENCDIKNEIVFEQINISSCLKNDGLLMLKQMNITYNSLFPDLIGSANDANQNLDLLGYIKQKQLDAWNLT